MTSYDLPAVGLQSPISRRTGQMLEGTCQTEPLQHTGQLPGRTAGSLHDSINTRTELFITFNIKYKKNILYTI